MRINIGLVKKFKIFFLGRKNEIKNNVYFVPIILRIILKYNNIY